MNRTVIAAVFACILLISSAYAAVPEGTHKFDGNCAYGLTMGKQVPTDCKVTWKDPATHATYCFLNEHNKAEFVKNSSVNTAKAAAEYQKFAALKKSSDTLSDAHGKVAKAQEGMEHAGSVAHDTTTAGH